MRELDWFPSTASLGDMRFPTEELERLRQQALMTWKVDKRYLAGVVEPTMYCLDVGCGPGLQALLISEFAHQGRVIGLDNNEVYLRIAKKVAVASGKDNIKFVIGDANKLGFENSTFDFIFSRLIFQHLKSPEQALSAIYRILKPRGRVMILETDGTWVISPYCEAFNEMFLAYEQWIAKRPQGGNRQIGREIGDMLAMTHFLEISVKKEFFNFDREAFTKIVLAIFPPIREQMVVEGIISEHSFDENMKNLEDFSATKLQSLALPLYYWTAVK